MYPSLPPNSTLGFSNVIQLRCTGSVQKQFGLAKQDLAEIKPPLSALGNWYVNQVTIERQKTLIFMNERTLLSFILYGVKKRNSKVLGGIFLQGATQLLSLEGFDEQQIDAAFGGDHIVELTKTDNRSALGNLKDLALIYEHQIWHSHGWNYCNVGELIMKNNRMPQRNIGWGYSIDLTRELLA
jgi:hypothetical protein